MGSLFYLKQNLKNSFIVYGNLNHISSGSIVYNHSKI